MRPLLFATAALAASSFTASLAARADAPAAEVALDRVIGACGGTAPSLEAVPGQGFTLTFADLAVTVDGQAAFARKACFVKLTAVAPPGFRLQRSTLAVAGAADFGSGSLGGRVSARYYAPGDSGASLFKSLEPASGHTDLAETSAQEPAWLPCGESVSLTILVEASARAKAPADGSDQVDASTLRVATVTVPPLLYKRCTPE